MIGQTHSGCGWCTTFPLAKFIVVSTMYLSRAWGAGILGSVCLVTPRSFGNPFSISIYRSIALIIIYMSRKGTLPYVYWFTGVLDKSYALFTVQRMKLYRLYRLYIPVCWYRQRLICVWDMSATLEWDAHDRPSMISYQCFVVTLGMNMCGRGSTLRLGIALRVNIALFRFTYIEIVTIAIAIIVSGVW